MLTNRALWAIERNLDRPLTLSEIAEACGVSRYHLAHAFGATLGLAVMHYVRARRLTIAAQRLAGGANDILTLALDSGYGSHEAFSRAFRAEFGVTPETVRQKASTEDLAMVKAAKLLDASQVRLDEPRIVRGEPMLLVGLSGRHSFATNQNIPAQWQKFMAAYGTIRDKTPAIPIGVATDMDDDGNFTYVCGQEVSKVSAVPPGLIELRIPAQTYAVFVHREHVSTIGATYAAILNGWLPDHNRTAANGPVIERHLATFDPRTGLGGVEIWIPLKE